MTMESEGVAKEEGGGGKEKPKEEEEDQHCTTPTGSGNRIPEVQNCPPAPRKRRRSTLTRRSFTAHELHFFEDTRLQEQGTEGKGGGNKGTKRKREKAEKGGVEYRRYVCRVLKLVHTEMGLSFQAMTILNNLMTDMFERLADEATRLKTYTGHMTLSSREIQGAVKLVLPGELGRHAIAEGTKAVNNYMPRDARH